MPKSFLSRRSCQNGVGDFADPGLDGGAVLDQRCDMSRRSFKLTFAGFAHGEFRQFVRDGHQVIDLETCSSVSPSTRGIWSFTSAMTRCACRGGRFHHPAFDAEADKAVGIRRADVQQGHIQVRGCPCGRGRGNSERKTGVKSARPSFTAAPDVLADEHGIDPQMALHSRGDVMLRAEGQHLVDFHILKLAARAAPALREAPWGPNNFRS